MSVKDLASLSERLQRLAWKEARKDPCVFLRTFVKTLDEHDAITPVKRFPYLPVFEHLTAKWRDLLPGQHLIIAKSRQLMASWWAIAMVLHELMSKPGRLVGVVSKKESDAAKLIGETRMGVIARNLPYWLQESYPIEETKTAVTVRHGRRDPPSVCLAMPQGAHQARMHTFSMLFFDEAAFQDALEDAIVGAKPTLHGGGRLLVVSSASPGTFEDIWRGKWGGQ